MIPIYKDNDVAIYLSKENMDLFDYVMKGAEKMPFEDKETERFYTKLYKQAYIFSLYKGDKLIGCCAIKQPEDSFTERMFGDDYDDGKDYFEQGWLFIDPEYRRKGYAKKLNNVCLDWYRDNMHDMCHVFYVTINNTNEASIKLYENNPRCEFINRGVRYNDCTLSLVKINV